MNPNIQYILDNYVGACIILVVFTTCICFFFYFIHRLYPNPITSILHLIRIAIDEFNPKKTKNIIEVLNALGVIIFSAIIFLVLLVYFGHSIFNKFFDPGGDEGKIISSLNLLFIILAIVFISSLIIIKVSLQEKSLRDRAKRVISK
jgi:hypothetical protein